MARLPNWLIELLVVSSVAWNVESAGIEPMLFGVQNLAPRALNSAPDGYTPRKVPCPQGGARVRVASELSTQEREWLTKRRKNTVAPMRDLLTRLKINGFDAGKYIDQISVRQDGLPNIGIAFSGGGYRALLNGAGALAAFDDRTPGAKDAGHIGGVLQSSTYVSGLSGGGWLVGSVWSNNFSSVHDILNSPRTLWNFENSLLEGSTSKRLKSVFGVAEHLKDIYDSVMGKRDALYDTSLTDFWARAISYQLVNATDGGPGYTWSSVADQPGYPDGQVPMPIVVANARNSGQIIISKNATVFEFNPYEMGSWDPTLYGMAPIKYIGSRFDNGEVVNNECSAGLDNAAFVMGTSSSLFNTPAMALAQSAPNIGWDALRGLLTKLAGKLSGEDNDIASWSPNPFLGFRKGAYRDADAQKLGLVDGGMDGQNIPLYPHIQPQRQVDVLIAVDSSGDTGNGAGWPNGTSLIATYQRSLTPDMQNGTAFPAIPDVNTFINLGLLDKPTFFGCDAKNQTGPTPLIVYMPNHPYTFWSNITTFTTNIPREDRDNIIRNGYNIATMGNSSVDATWPQCLGCAIISRSLDRSKTAVPQACQDCFKKHCWSGALDSRKAKYEPAMVNPKGTATTTSSGKKKNVAAAVSPSLSGVLAMVMTGAVMAL